MPTTKHVLSVNEFWDSAPFESKEARDLGAMYAEQNELAKVRVTRRFDRPSAPQERRPVLPERRPAPQGERPVPYDRNPETREKRVRQYNNRNRYSTPRPTRNSGGRLFKAPRSQGELDTVP